MGVGSPEVAWKAAPLSSPERRSQSEGSTLDTCALLNLEETTISERSQERINQSQP